MTEEKPSRNPNILGPNRGRWFYYEIGFGVILYLEFIGLRSDVSKFEIVFVSRRCECFLTRSCG